MAVQLILGSSGAGKSYYAYTQLLKEEKSILIVPEQFTMQTQKEIVAMDKHHGTMSVDIVSFQRLAYRIFNELNYIPHDVLEDIGKSIVVRKILQEYKKELTVFAGSLKKQGFVDEVKSFLSECYQYKIGPEQLAAAAGKIRSNSMLHSKLKDMQQVMNGFEQFMSGHFIAAEQLLSVLAEQIKHSQIIKDSVICIDGFTGFTPVQYDLLGELFLYAKKVVILITIDPRNLPFKNIYEIELFHLSKKTIRAIEELVNQRGVAIEPPIILKEEIPFRFQNKKELAFLERNLFRYPGEVYKEPVQDISIHITRNPREEALFVVRKIRRLAAEQGLRYRDMAIVTGDLTQYGPEIEYAMGRLSVPYFMDNNISILNNSCIETIRAALDVIQSDFTYEHIFRYLKAGLSSLEGEQIDWLENYIIAAGIRGYGKWKKAFTRNLRKLTETEVEGINLIREQFMEELMPLKQGLSDQKTVRENITVIFNFMMQMRMQEKLTAKERFFNEQGNLVQAKAYSQVYAIVVGLFDKLVEVLGDEVMSLEELVGILDTGLLETTVGVIPPGIDQVLVGDIERTRLKDIKVLFFMGVNDGIIPKPLKGGGIITDRDRDVLSGEQIELAPTSKQNTATEQFYLYLNVTKPEQQLILSLSKVNSNGKSLNPSYFIHTLTNIFPQLVLADQENEMDHMEQIYTREDSIDALIHGVNQYLAGKEETFFFELLDLFKEQDQTKAVLDKVLAGAFYKNEESAMNRAVAKALYGEHLNNSVTRLEKYAACAFAHFLRYGLQIQEREEYEIRSLDIGNVFHKTIELYSREMTSRGYDWQTITDDQRETFTEECVNQAVELCDQDVFYSSARNKYIIEMVTRIAKRTTWALTEHIQRGQFEPQGFELSFKDYHNLSIGNISLEQGASMTLNGTIDRMDVYEDEDNVYLKIIDYKSGNTSFDIVDLYYGLQIQLVVYLNGAMEIAARENKDKKVIPAGIFYYNIKDPMILSDGQEEPTALLKELKMNGIANSAEEILDYFESEDSERFVSIPVATLKNGGLSKQSKIADTNQFAEMGQFVKKKIKQLGNQMMAGNIDIKPYALGNKTACDFCEYHSVCSFDKRNKFNQFRKLKSYHKDDIWTKIHEDIGEEEN